ncbi:hypothetical protein ABB37_09718 [Leptomonas pyrrhocoris]|uniref:N-acetyltransferase ESCO zinc-finger domain-containing protein n=1 Tax=Leptomonas pyrrhocoris TaxID=157538 RepID=A0A0M9FQ40_LEPPY|nr:hypothetical protein ABB37_09718 [Leptomonas pyrrhocoris]KPA73586.1 hypothetical protein ABB37_09718 [Leptomonas pyrrhocoris]|eukprot:XP_015652025.1 hypothetical protein ABB37_09718 [Leptomonas pyrrhocoris]
MRRHSSRPLLSCGRRLQLSCSLSLPLSPLSLFSPPSRCRERRDRSSATVQSDSLPSWKKEASQSPTLSSPFAEAHRLSYFSSLSSAPLKLRVAKPSVMAARPATPAPRRSQQQRTLESFRLSSSLTCPARSSTPRHAVASAAQTDKVARGNAGDNKDVDDDDDDVPLAAFLMETDATSGSADYSTHMSLCLSSSAGNAAVSSQSPTHNASLRRSNTASNAQTDRVTEASLHPQISRTTFPPSLPPSPPLPSSTRKPSPLTAMLPDSHHHHRQQQPRQQQQLTQTTLDLGQRGSGHIGQRCPQCQMLFNANAEDAALHKRYCRAQQRRQRRRRTEREAAGGDGVVGGTQHAPAETVLESAQRTKTVAAEVRAGERAVDLLEALLGGSVGAALGHAEQHSASTRGVKLERRAAGASLSRKRMDTSRAGAKPSLSSSAAAVAASANDGSFSCFRALTLSSSNASPSVLLHPIEVVVVRSSGTQLEEHSAWLLELLELVGFTRHLWTPSFLDEMKSGAGEEVRRATTFVFVVDVVLRQLVSAVAGSAHQREQDPQLCVRQRADGSTTCGTQRCFTFGDVLGVWAVSQRALSYAQKAWEAETAALFACQQDALQRFFKPPRTAGTPTRSADDLHCSSGSGGDNADEGSRSERQHRHRQHAVGVALHAVARHLTYGTALCPFTQLSYALSAPVPTSSRACDASLAADTRWRGAHGGATALDEAAREGDWLLDCLRSTAAALLFNGADTSTPPKPVIVDSSIDCTLYFHNDGDGAEGEEETMDVTGVGAKDRKRRRRRCLLSSADGYSDGSGGDVGDELSVVSYSSEP